MNEKTLGSINVSYPRQVLSPRARIILDMCPQHANRILDSGCGRGELLTKLAQRNYNLMVGVDISDDSIRTAKSSGAELVKADAGVCVGTLPFRENTFDVICLVEILTLFKDDYSVISEHAKLLNRGGGLIVCVAFNPKLWNDEDLMIGHYRRYDYNGLESLIKSAGLDIVDVRYSGFPFYWLSRCMVNRIIKKRDKGVSTGNLGQRVASKNIIFRMMLELAIRIELLFQRLPLGTFIIVKAQKKQD